ncbi:putative peptide ABC transporter ATP-binding protein [Bordetella holmesii 70147]|nr:putative peptide ABC transporter ATP-binding protein [Bordetella holmesii ATCC 51541]AIT28471.1 putative peptide ABC transporter ATP-binding protein [Bordetella holmesii 44057]EWM45152.1 putative peptide ABC transporter ATP-binding protein [Bordetella holmesii 70147]
MTAATQSLAPLTLEVRNLRTHFQTRAGTLPAVDDVSFRLERGKILGLVGESGSGKSVTGFSIMGLVAPRAAWSMAAFCSRAAT